MNYRIGRKLGILLLVTFFVSPFSGTAAPLAWVEALQEENSEVVLENGYKVTFDEVISNGDGTSTWYYTLQELPEAQDLSNWVLETPFCAPIVDAGPKPWEIVDPDPNAQLSGVKWDTGDKFEQGQFWVTLETGDQIGITNLAAKGPDMAWGQIAGPSCVEGVPPSDPPVETGDDVPPTLEWVAPVKEMEVYDLHDGDMVDLVLEAGDNVGVERVEILRWDATVEKFKVITIDKKFPYQVKVSAGDFNPTWNQVFAASFDDSNNRSDWKWIWVYRVTSGPLFEPPGTNLFIPLVIR